MERVALLLNAVIRRLESVKDFEGIADMIVGQVLLGRHIVKKLENKQVPQIVLCGILRGWSHI